MAPSSGGSCFSGEMRRRLAAMRVALLQDDDSSCPRAVVGKRKSCQVWGSDQAPSRSTSDWVQVDHEFQRQLREILFGSEAESGLMAILASRRALCDEQCAKLIGVSMHGFRLGMPVTMFWLAAQPFGAVPLGAWSNDMQKQAEPKSKACASGAASVQLYSHHLNFQEDPIPHTTEERAAHMQDPLNFTAFLEDPIRDAIKQESDEGPAAQMGCQDSWALSRLALADDCCDFDCEVGGSDGGQFFAIAPPILRDPTPSVLDALGERTQEPARNEQDPQRAKKCVSGGLLPQEWLETRPAEGLRSREMSSLTPNLSPTRAPLALPASPCASHGLAKLPWLPPGHR